MKIDIKKDNTWPVILSIIFTLLLLFLGFNIHLIDNVDIIINFRSIFEILFTNKFMWILLSLLLVIPAVVYIIARKFNARSSAMETKITTLGKAANNITNYVDHLINENYATGLESNQENEKLVKSLINLRDTLKSNKELVDKQRKEDENRNWHAEGHAKFGDILRNNNDFEVLAFNVIKNLTDYVDGVQGGFFHLEEDDEGKHFNLLAFYAYGRKKYADKRTPWGKGLIGTSAVEKKTIHMDSLPDGYVSVTSGLGQTNPKQVVVCPLISDDHLFGVLEIASLTEIDKDKVKFIEKVADNTASTLSAVRLNMQTKNLLEESKEQSQTLAAQEEEMRQNMEELKATQEEAGRQAERFMRLEDTVNHTMIRAEYNMEGILIFANLNFLKKLEYTSNSQVEGKHISMFISKKDEEWFENIWQNLALGGRHFEGYMKHVTKNGKDLWTMATYTCIRDEDGNAERLLFLALDTTEQKKISLNLEGFMDAVNRSSINVEFDTNGNIGKFSESLLNMFKYSESEITRLNISDFIDPLELETFNKKWENIVNGMNFEGNFRIRTKDGQEGWIQGAFSAVYNEYEEVDKVILIGHDITTQKIMEIENKNQNDVLKKQEKLLRESEKELSKKLRIAKQEMQEQFKEIERTKIRNERTLEGALDTIIQISTQSKIIFYNHAAENLLGYSKQEVIDKSIGMFFSDEIIKENDFVSKLINTADNKIIGARAEIKIRTKNGDELAVLCLLSRAQVEKEITYTAFIQTIEVELF